MPTPEDRSFHPETQEDVNRSESQHQLDAQDAGEGSVEGLQQGRTATNREHQDEADDLQGSETTEANRDRVRGAQDMNP